jgi:prophage regulatory protein
MSTSIHSYQLPEKGLVRLNNVLLLFPVSRSKWWAGCSEGIYPAPVRLPGSRCVAWRAEDIRALIDSAAQTGGKNAKR